MSAALPLATGEFQSAGGSLASRLGTRRMLKAVAVASEGTDHDREVGLLGASIVRTVDRVRTQLMETAEDLYRISSAAQASAMDGLREHDAMAEGALRDVTGAVQEAEDAVLLIRRSIRESGTDPEAHPTDELVSATTALAHAREHADEVERSLTAARAGLEAAWCAAARQRLQDGVLLLSVAGEEVTRLRGEYLLHGDMEPLPSNVVRSNCNRFFTFEDAYPFPVFGLTEVVRCERPASQYAAGGAS